MADAKKLNTLDAGHRVKGFLDAHDDVIHMPPETRALLDNAVADLEAHLGVQASSTGTAMGETAIQKQLRNDIYHDFIGPIGAVATYLGINDARLQMYARIDRHGEFNNDIELLIMGAAEHEAVLAPRLLRPDFLAKLRGAVERLRTSTASRSRLWGQRSGATGGIEAAHKELNAHIRGLDAGITPLLLGNPALLADWKSSCRIHKTRIDPRPGGSIEPPNDEEKPPK